MIESEKWLQADQVPVALLSHLAFENTSLRAIREFWSFEPAFLA